MELKFIMQHTKTYSNLISLCIGYNNLQRELQVHAIILFCASMMASSGYKSEGPIYLGYLSLLLSENVAGALLCSGLEVAGFCRFISRT